jgi:hypothetical protein
VVARAQGESGEELMRDLILSIRDAMSGLSTQGSPRALVVLILIIAAVVLIAVLAMLLIPRRSSTSRVARRLAERAVVRRDSRSEYYTIWVWRLVLVATVVTSVVVGNDYLGRDGTCLQCHKGSKEAAALKNTAHAATACVKCHQPAGVMGALRQSVAYGRMLTVFAQTRAAPETVGSELVENSACFRCHADVAHGTVTANGVKVRHSDFLKQGAKCTGCHTASAHPQAIVNATQPTMDKCTTCHDGVTATYECATCHEQDVAANSDITRYGKVDLVTDSDACYRCHDEAPCTGCHGVKMPHPENWMTPAREGTNIPGHARLGFAQRERCFRCHFAEGKPFVGSDEACSCHGLLGRMHGGAPWVREHGLQATGQKPGQAARCFDCHGQGLCEGCHPPEYAARYNPVTGVDNYPREISPDPLQWDW